MSGVRVFFYVQYLEGIGHAVRASRIAEALAQRGARVTLVLGGEPVPHLKPDGCRIVQLPPLRATPESYSSLVTPDGAPVDAAYKAGRCANLLEAFAAAKPDAVITEGYPFGRWAMEFELGPLLQAASACGPDRPLVLASLRDILQVPKDEAKVARSLEIYARHFDAMLIHGDPRLTRVETSFPAIAPFLDSAYYTGLVAPGAPAGAGPSDPFDVIVSAGGGAIAERVLKAAISAKPLSPLAKARWLALTGPRLPDDALTRLTVSAEQNGVTLERFRPHLADLLARACLSIQRAGYNTVADLLVAGCRAVLIPDSDHRQREQPLRAARLEALGRAVTLREADLTRETMAQAMKKALAQNIAAVDLDLDGAQASARIILDLCTAHQPTKVRSHETRG
jgi:predicted glycosyltransferase